MCERECDLWHWVVYGCVGKKKSIKMTLRGTPCLLVRKLTTKKAESDEPTKCVHERICNV